MKQSLVNNKGLNRSSGHMLLNVLRQLGKIELNGPGRRKLEGKISWQWAKPYHILYGATPGLNERIFLGSWLSAKGDLNFCVLGAPLRDAEICYSQRKLSDMNG